MPHGCTLGGMRKVEHLSTSACPSLVGVIDSGTFSLSHAQTKLAHEVRERFQVVSTNLYIISQMLHLVQSKTEKENAEC